MKYLWIGVCLSQAQREEIVKRGGKLLSANVSQDALLAGLEQNGVCFDSINGHRFPASFRTVKEERWSRNGESCDVSVGYRNVKYLSVYSKKRALVREGRAWARRHKNEDVTVLIYSMHSPFLACAAAIKKIIPRATVALIVPDLPQFMDLHMSRLKRLLKAIDWRTIKKHMRGIDKYILYSRHMASFLELKEGSWTVMEGSFDPSTVVDEESQRPEGKLPIMYSGVLDTRYGIIELLDAMKELDDRFELWFTGAGNAVPLIKERAEKDSRIRFYGYLPSRYDLLLKQRQAAMLISTRDPEEVASAYCFPSKIFEYMVSGNPVISTRIKGIPEEYFEYLVPLDTITPKEIADKINHVASMGDAAREALGEGGRQFVLNEKNNVAQAKNILNFVTNK